MITITKINANTYHFEDEDKDLVILTDKDVVLEKKTGAYWLKLPTNSCNRKLINIKKFDNEPTIKIDTYKESVTFGPRTDEPREKKPLEDYLEDEDRKLYLELLEKAKKNRGEANKRVPLTPLEKKKREVARLQAEIARMESEEA